MKIMMVAAGDSIHAVRWANVFIDKGHDVDFVTLANHRPRIDSFSERVKLFYLKHRGSKGYYLNALELHRIWKRISPDVVNVHYASGYGMLARLAGLRKTVLSVWGSDVYEFPYKNKIANRIVTKNLKGVDAIALTSKCMAAQVEKLIGAASKPIIITPFGVDVNQLCPSEKDSYSNEKKEFTFGIVKKLTYKYGIDYVIKAYAILLDRYMELEDKKLPFPKLFICGKGENKGDFEKLRDKLGLHDYVTIKGYIPHDKIPDVIRSIDVFCLGSNDSESFGVAAVEAMACGIPIVATDVDGFKEVMVDGYTGYIVPRKDEKVMADKMWELYLDADKRREFGMNGRQHVLKNYSWDENVSTLVTLLEEISKKGD